MCVNDNSSSTKQFFSCCRGIAARIVPAADAFLSAAVQHWWSYGTRLVTAITLVTPYMTNFSFWSK